VTLATLIPTPPELAFIILAATVGLFIWGRPRVDIVAVMALTACVLTGLVAPDEAFAGFGHPAVITVAAVLGLSSGLSRSGAIDLIAVRINRVATGRTAQMVALSSLGGVLSGFMNNVGALALLMPVALSMARKGQYHAGTVLMPLAFATILGGLITLIGTPPNLLVAQYRASALGDAFGLFDFAWVGVPLALSGIAFVTLAGWRLLPAPASDRPTADEPFAVEGYLTELVVPPESPVIGKVFGELLKDLDEPPGIVGFIRRNRRPVRHINHTPLQARDVIMATGETSQIEALVSKGFAIVPAKDLKKEDGTGPIDNKALMLLEVVVTPGSRLEGTTAARMRLRQFYTINMLALAREGQPVRHRLKNVVFRAGDVLLLQGERDTVHDTARTLGCLPLAERKISLEPRKALVPVLIFAAAIASIVVGWLPAAAALTTGLLAMVLTGVLRAREAYEAIDLKVIVLLAAMIPVGGALESSGAAGILGNQLANLGGSLPAWLVLGLVLIVTMTLSDIMNNAATAVVMAPITINLSSALGVNPDPMLMAVAIGASSAFLTPIGHQNNLLVMGPGGYRFGDYWRMGLPLEILLVTVSVLLIPLVWPF